MEFYNKLQRLRKQNGMSQEELANHLGVSRQAVSKWENGQGYPETDKLVQISGLFHVSLDYLLKEDEGIVPAAAADETPPAGREFYASREMVETYLQSRWQGIKQVTLGVAIIILSMLWMFNLQNSIGFILFFLQAAAGIGILIMTGFRPKRYDKRMEEDPLVFDPAFLRELQARHQGVRKTSGGFIVAGIMLCILSVVSIVLTQTVFVLSEGISISIMFVFIATGVSMIIPAASRMEAYGMFADNAAYMKEQEEEKASGWVMGTFMILATAIFLLLLFKDGNAGGAVAGRARLAWIVYPVAALVGAAVTGVVNALRKKK